MAISVWAVSPLDSAAEMDMPGMFCIKLDMCGPGIYDPWPLNYGPMCERCWLDDGFVCAVSHPACEHGGAS